MNVELTIQSMFDNYPTLFKERSDCLNHLFCAIGNGYFWESGELVDGYEYDDEEVSKLERELVNGKAFQHNKISIRSEHMLYAKEWEEEHPDFPKLPEKFFYRYPDNVYHNEPRQKRWYFSEKRGFGGSKGIVIVPENFYLNFAYMWKYPDDIKSDWLEAIRETKAFLSDDGFNLPNIGITL